MGISHSVDIDQFLRSNRHIHPEVMDVWGKDTNQDLESDFESSKLKVLLVFLSPLSTRAFSSTYSCISTLMKSVFEKQEECFVDACWYHSREFQDILNSHDIPVMFGNVSHKSWINYDIVCISHAISPECFNVPVIYQKSDFPYSHEERMNNDECPLVFYGGAASISMFPILGGEIPGHGKSFYDVGMLGAGETTIPVVFKILKEFRDKKSIKANKKELLDLLLDTEYTNKYCLYPWLYSFDYEDDNVTIKKINRLDPRIPEKVEIGRVKFPIFKGFNRKMFWPNGLNCDSTDIQISSGCSSYCCSFCSEAQEAGHWTEKPIEQIASDMQESKRYSAANTYSPFSFNSNYYGAYNDMLKLFIDNGSAISLLNQRMDVIGSEQGGEYLKLAKKLGLIRASAAVEGSLRGSELILTENGYKPISEIQIGEKVVSRNGVLREVVNKIEYPSGRKRMFRVTTEHGRTFVCSDNHPFLTKDSDECECKDIIGKFIKLSHTVSTGGVVPTGYADVARVRNYVGSVRSNGPSCIDDSPNPGLYSTVTNDLAWLLGWLVGDGCINYEGRNKFNRLVFYFGEKDREVLPLVKNILNLYGIQVSETLDKNGVIRLTVGNGLFVDFVRYLGFNSSGEGKNIPQWIFQSPFNIQSSFLNGLFSSDGYSSKNEVYLSQNNERLCRDISYLLDQLGILTTVRKAYRKGGYKGSSDSYWIVRVYRHDYEKFYRIVGFTQSYKKLDGDVRLRNKLSEWDRVVSVEPVEDCISYDLTIKDDPYYVVNGLISHNCGDRIRNHILNKNLPKDVLINGARNIFKQKLIMLKLGMILTGLETDSDIDEMCSELDAIIKAREEEGANTALQMKWTPLVYYLQTPLRWQKRIASENSWCDKKSAGRIVEELRKRNIRQGYNATGIGNWVEQFIIDSGWAGTPILFEYGITYNKDYVAGFPAKLKPMFQELLAKYKIPIDFNWHKYDPDTAIFPIDVVAFTTEKKLSEWKEMDKKNDFYHPICLRTPANPNSKCYNCGACDNADEKKQVFARNISASKHTVVDVLNSLTSSKCASAVRITVKSSPQFDFYSKEMLSHYISSQFLRRDDKLADRFYKVQSNSLSWATQYDQLDYYSGLWSFDLEFKQLVSASQLRPYIDDINSILETCKIVSVVDTSDSLEISVKYFNLYSVNIPLSMSVLNDRVSNFDWQVKIAKKAMQGMELELVDFTEYKKNLLLGVGGSGSVMTMVLPMKFNPYLVVGSIVKKGQDWCYQNLECTLWETGRPLDAVCKCGNPLYYSMTSDKVVNECLLCRSRKVLYKLTH